MSSGTAKAAKSSAKISEAVAEFATLVGAEGPVAVLGNRTHWDVGGAPSGTPRLVRAPSGVVDYQPEEMTVRVLAGTTIADLNDSLAQYGQRTALPDGSGTVGGALAVGENHHNMLSVGPVRNALLKVTYISAEGKVVAGGGATVKNVSGFDLPRLIVGSLGTLGCIAEVILRTNPIPPVRRWFQTVADPFELYDKLLDPGAILWDGTTTWLLLEGHDVDVERQAEGAAAIGELQSGTPPPKPVGQNRWSVPPGDLGRVMDGLDGPALASIGVGTIWASEPQLERPLTAAVGAVHDRMKTFFDPAGRLNPGRHPARK